MSWNTDQSRFQSTKAQPQAMSKEKKATKSSSFVQNAFRGLVEPEQTFPFPEVIKIQSKVVMGEVFLHNSLAGVD